MGPDASKRDTLMDQVPSQKKFDWLTAGQFSFSLLIGLFLIGRELFIDEPEGCYRRHPCC